MGGQRSVVVQCAEERTRKSIKKKPTSNQRGSGAKLSKICQIIFSDLCGRPLGRKMFRIRV